MGVNTSFTMRVGSYVEVPINRGISVGINAEGTGTASYLITFDALAAAFEEYTETEQGMREEEIIDSYDVEFEVTEATHAAETVISAPTEAIRMGDLNGDGQVTSADATLLARWLVTRGTEDENDEIFAYFCKVAANVTLSGNDPGPDDLVYLARWLVGTAPAPFR